MNDSRVRHLIAALAAAFALAAAGSVHAGQCLRAETPPDPPPKGAVLAVPIDDNIPDKPNVVVLGFHEDNAVFQGNFGETCMAIARNPRTITVARDGGSALVFYTPGGNIIWGGELVNVEESDPAPEIWPGNTTWKLTGASVEDAGAMLENFATCRGCDLANRNLTLRAIPEPGSSVSFAYLGNVSFAYFGGSTLAGTAADYDFTQADFKDATLKDIDLSRAKFETSFFENTTFSGAVLKNAIFHHIETFFEGRNTLAPVRSRFIDGSDLSGANFSGTGFNTASLSNVTFDDVTVDGTVFDTADLRGAHFESLRFQEPPSFNSVVLGGVSVGSGGNVCTSFENLDLRSVSFTGARWIKGCVGPLFKGSQVSLSAVDQIVTVGKGHDIDWTGAQAVASAADRKVLAGVDLSGVSLAGLDFLGEPLDLTGTKFDGANLTGTNLSLARFAGATFENVKAAGASFTDADFRKVGDHPAASFAGPNTDLQGANFVDADVSGVSFQSANLSGAVFSGARGSGTNFNGVVAKQTVFAGAHLYGNGLAFDDATDMEGVNFTDAVLASDPGQSGGFDFTGAPLTSARFDGAVCVACNFTGAKLNGASFTGAYLPGAVLSSATLADASLDRAWLYCGSLDNNQCTPVQGTPPHWAWPLALGSGEAFGPVPFAQTNLTGANLAGVIACPSGKAGSTPPTGCEGHLLPRPAEAPPIPAPCSASAHGACPTATSTVFDASTVGQPLAIVASAPPTWNTLLPSESYYVAFDDGTIRVVGEDTPSIIAGTPGTHCPRSDDPCGDGGPAKDALLNAPTGLAVGLDGSLYVADFLRVRRIDPTGTITTVAGTGEGCANCGDDGKPATQAKLGSANGIWIDPLGVLLIADGTGGVRRVAVDGTIGTVAAGYQTGNVQAVTASEDGLIYATTSSPDGIIKIDPATSAVTTVVGTGTSGYNGHVDEFGEPLPGDEVQVNGPQGLAVDLDGNVLFADTGNNLIRAYVPSSGFLAAVVAGDDSELNPDDTPKGGFNGDGHPATATQLQGPRSVTATRSVLRVVADTVNRRVRLVGPAARRNLGSGTPPGLGDEAPPEGPEPDPPVLGGGGSNGGGSGGGSGSGGRSSGGGCGVARGSDDFDGSKLALVVALVWLIARRRSPLAKSS